MTGAADVQLADGIDASLKQVAHAGVRLKGFRRVDGLHRRRWRGNVTSDRRPRSMPARRHYQGDSYDTQGF